MAVAEVLAVLGAGVPLYVLMRLQLGLVAGWTAFVEALAGHLKQSDLDGAEGLCRTVAGSVMAPVAQLGLRLLSEAPDEQQQAERHFAVGLAPALVRQQRRVMGLGRLALLGALPAAAMGLGVRFDVAWTRYVAFGALLLGLFAAFRAYQIKNRIVPRIVAALIGVLSAHAARR